MPSRTRRIREHGIWNPQNDFALYPISVSAIASKADGHLLAGGGDDVQLPLVGHLRDLVRQPEQRFVSPDMAETTTTTTSFPWSFVRATLFATFLIFSMVPTEVPPYFWTMSAISRVTLLAYSVWTVAGECRQIRGGPGRRPGSPCSSPKMINLTCIQSVGNMEFHDFFRPLHQAYAVPDRTSRSPIPRRLPARPKRR